MKPDSVDSPSWGGQPGVHLRGRGTTRVRVLFRTSRRLTTLEHFRIPYEVDGLSPSSGVEHLRSQESGSALLWPAARRAADSPVAAWLDASQEHRIPIFARVLSDQRAQPLLAGLGGSWARHQPVSTFNGNPIGSVWRDETGNTFLPFDPDEVRLNLLSERYREVLLAPRARKLHHLSRRGYYRIRGSMPRSVQIWLRQRYARLQSRTAFPRWPVEPGLHDFLDYLLTLLSSIAGEPVPMLAAWPDGYSWSLVLTHDVETQAGLQALEPVLELERAHGLRSSWNLVPRRYKTSDDDVQRLMCDGFEVGVHGLYHDGRDLESAKMLHTRLPDMTEAAKRWGAVGFRSPATQRDWALIPAVGLDYDSSYPDTDPFEPQGGGCCSWLPFFIGGLVELPMTMPQDHTLFVILRQHREQVWVTKAEFLRSRGGMVLLDTHPDYLVDKTIFSAYAGFLDRFADDPAAWKALPREVSDWWRRRADSKLDWDGTGWKVAGPAAEEGRIEFAPPPS